MVGNYTGDVQYGGVSVDGEFNGNELMLLIRVNANGVAWARDFSQGVALPSALALSDDLAVVVGNYSGPFVDPIDFAMFPEPTEGASRGWVALYALDSGNGIWAHPAESDFSDFTTVAVAPTGIVVGGVFGSVFAFDGEVAGPSLGTDTLIMVLDEEGRLVRTDGGPLLRTIGSSEAITLAWGVDASDQRIVLAGTTDGSLTFGAVTYPKRGDTDIWVAGLDLDLQQQWTETFGTEKERYFPFDVAISDDGDQAIVGGTCDADLREDGTIIVGRACFVWFDGASSLKPESTVCDYPTENLEHRQAAGAVDIVDGEPIVGGSYRGVLPFGGAMSRDGGADTFLVRMSAP